MDMKKNNVGRGFTQFNQYNCPSYSKIVFHRRNEKYHILGKYCLADESKCVQCYLINLPTFIFFLHHLTLSRIPYQNILTIKRKCRRRIKKISQELKNFLHHFHPLMYLLIQLVVTRLMRNFCF